MRTNGILGASCAVNFYAKPGCVDIVDNVFLHDKDGTAVEMRTDQGMYHFMAYCLGNQGPCTC